MTQLVKLPASQSCESGCPSEVQNSGGSSVDGSSISPLRPQALGSSMVNRRANALTDPACAAATIASRASSAPIRAARIPSASAAGSQSLPSVS